MNQATNVNIVPSYGQRGDLHFSQYDVGRTATINLYAVNEAYTIPLSATVKIQATKPSGLGFDVACTFSGSVVTVVSTETMTDEYGRFPCELRIENGGVLLGTTNFTFNVEKSPHPTNTVDGDSEDIINQITVALNNALSDIEDAKDEAIEEISQSGGGITEAVKVALLNCFAHTAWIDENGQTYYDALYDALYDVPAPTLTSISAVYTQSGTVYTTDTLDSLKSDLVVTATYSDSSTATVPSADYTLSGTLTAGTSTITVTYQELTTTFNVTVSSEIPSQYTWLYNADSGEKLSEQDYVTVTSTGTTSETLSNGELICHVDNNGTATSGNSNLLTFAFTDTTSNDAVITAKAKLVDLPLADTQGTPIGQRFQLSNGTSGSAMYFLNRSGKIEVQYNEGATTQTYTTDYNVNEYHIFETRLSNGHQILKIDGVQVVDTSTLSTSYATANMVRLQASNTTRCPNGVTTHFKWVAYYEVS